MEEIKGEGPELIYKKMDRPCPDALPISMKIFPYETLVALSGERSRV